MPNTFKTLAGGGAVRASDARRAYLEAHVFELLIAGLGVLAALGFFLEPGELARSPLGRAVHPFDYAWNVLYLVGGALIVAGLARPSYRLEVAGLVMFGAAIAGAGIAVAEVRGGSGATSVAIYAAAVGACAVRVNVVRRVEAALAEAGDELASLQRGRR